MDVINKLYCSVTSTVSQISSNLLLGNPLSRDFFIDSSNEIGSSGIGLYWKIFNGCKKSTKQDVSIFVFEKKQLERLPNKDDIIEIMKKGVVQLTKIRHPNILTIQHPLEESREILAFACEPVFTCMTNILESKNKTMHDTDADFKLYDVEIKYGILQLAEGLQFLHSDMKLIHRNINPSSIIINRNGAWKIFGFDFCVLNQATTNNSTPHWPFIDYNHVLSQPSLDYMAPENSLHSHSPASDLYSLGVLIYAIYSNGRPIQKFGKDYTSFKRFSCELKAGTRTIDLFCIPEGLRETVKQMLSATPELRPDLYTIRKNSFFDDVGVKTLSYLDSLFQWDNLQKSKFFKGLPQIIKIMPRRINIFRILPCLLKEFVNPPMIPFVLTNVLLIAENCNEKEFKKYIWDHLKPVMKITEPIQILFILMQNIELLLKLTTKEDVKTDVIPLLYTAIECNSYQTQELCLTVIPSFASLIDHDIMKNGLLPRIKKLCINSKLTSVKVNSLISIGKLLSHFDKWLVLDEIVPFLPKINSREPAIIMAICGIYRIILTHERLGMTKEAISTSVIPFLSPLCIENGLSLNQFQTIMTLMKELIQRIETEQQTKLEQINMLQKVSRDSTEKWIQEDDLFRDIEQKSSVNTFNQKITIPDKTIKSIQFDQRPCLTIQGPSQNKPIQNVKDLTSTLIQSNLNQMNINSKNSFNASPNQINIPINIPSNSTSNNMQHNLNRNLINLNMPKQNATSEKKNKNSSTILTTEEIMDFLK